MAVVRDSLPHWRRVPALGPALRAIAEACCALPAKMRVTTPNETAIHRARQALKRGRAVLRLGESLGLPRAKAARRHLARQARRLSPLRDATVNAQVAKKLAATTEGAAGRGLAWMAAKPPLARVGWWVPWKRELQANARRVHTLAWERMTAHGLEQALRHSVRRVRRRAEDVCDAATAHEWRKAVIILREQIAAVLPWFGRGEPELHPGLRQLAHRLGRAADLDVLYRAAGHRAWPKSQRAEQRKLLLVVRRERARAIAKAQKLWREDVRCILDRAFR